MRPNWVTDVLWEPSEEGDRARGLLGWVSLTLDGALRLHGLAVRRTRSGRLALAFPRRTDRRGREHSVIRPTCDHTRREIEAAVIGALEAQGDLP
jgi:DNA-binding cell septation regulator SpoVG